LGEVAVQRPGGDRQSRRPRSERRRSGIGAGLSGRTVEKEQQAEFVRWWKERVTPGQSPGRKGKKSSAYGRAIPLDQAEGLTGITKQQVSKWRKRLADRDARAMVAARLATAEAEDIYDKALKGYWRVCPQGRGGVGEGVGRDPEER
jgi:hypothetical protein